MITDWVGGVQIGENIDYVILEWPLKWMKSKLFGQTGLWIMDHGRMDKHGSRNIILEGEEKKSRHTFWFVSWNRSVLEWICNFNGQNN